MRVYLTRAEDILEVLEDGGTRAVSYPSAGFYANVKDELGQLWIDAGVAFNATPDNKAIAFVGTEQVLVDFDAGEKLGPQHTPKAVHPPEPEAPPPEEPQPHPADESGLE